MLKAISAWRRKHRSRRSSEPVAMFDEQLLADLGLTWEDVREAQAKRSNASSEGAVFP
ncbi:hypothetical protein [Devosia submarina]|uniref:hypothetical protein n=1 Tax=Devosia submarina TaxID=1173082 RepID=UPI0013006FBF|nr:hypothetical protein [Devosia submarina]